MYYTSYNTADSLSVTRSFAADIFEALDCSISLCFSIMLRYNDFSSYGSIECKPLDFNDAESFERNYRAFHLLRKSIGIIPSASLETETYRKYVKAELSVRETNRLFDLRDTGKFKFTNRVERILFYARRKIASIMSASRLFDHDCGFGPGASLACRGENTHLLCKTATQPICSEELWPHLRAYLTKCNSFVASILGCDIDGPTSILHMSHVEFSSLTSVPKDFRSNRTIAIEPDGHIFFQKMIGNWIRDCLLSEGLDLNTRQTVHERLAQAGSLDNFLSTVDLEMASDMISTGLVRDLLPSYMFKMLDKSRTKKIWLPSLDIYKLEKFSSMGNGFTFELETLLFYGILYGCCVEADVKPIVRDSHNTNISVFGDDIICPQPVVTLLREVFQSVGFTINAEKTFTEGVFRESCGHHFFLGRHIKLFRIKELLTDDFKRIDAINRLRSRTLVGSFSDPMYKRATDRLERRIHMQNRRYGPFYSYSTVIWCSIYDRTYGTSLRNCQLFIEYPSIVPRKETRRFSGNATLAARIYTAGGPFSFSKRGTSSQIRLKNGHICHLDRTWGAWLT